MVLVISFSGGETSAFMTGLLLNMFFDGRLDEKYTEVSVVFANTGQETEATLEFVRLVGMKFDVDITWLEAKINPAYGQGTKYTAVDFNSADRSGRVFEDMIKVYGIPNSAYPHCTRELKNEPIKKWCIDNFGKDYEIAIGIRIDESEREPKTNQYQTVYPLIYMELDKQDVLEYWESQDFRLSIANYQGNCKWCWKKSDKKLMLIAYENREFFNFPLLMESMHGLAGSNDDGTKRKFFRQHRSAKDILIMTDELMNERQVYEHERERIIKDYEKSPFGGGCSNECGAFSQESLF